MKKRLSPAYLALAQKMRNAVLQGELEPGKRLKIDELAHKFRMSAMPVRQALQALEDEGIVVTEMNKGATVRVIDERMASDLYDLRRAITRLVVADCVRNITESDIDRLRTLAAAQDDGDTGVAKEAQRKFFEELAAVGGNALASETLARHWPILVAAREVHGLTDGAVVAADQSPLLDALAKRSESDAIALAEQACDEAKHALMQKLKAALQSRAAKKQSQALA